MLNSLLACAQIYTKIKCIAYFWLADAKITYQIRAMRQQLFMFGFTTLLFMACTSSEQKENDRNQQYESSKLSVQEIEQQSPLKFLTVSGSDRKNLLGQTVVKGKITNKAKMVTYKDVDIKLSFYSKTGTLLQEDQEMVYETIAPGTSADFKTKYFSPKGTDSIAMKIVSAKF